LASFRGGGGGGGRPPPPPPPPHAPPPRYGTDDVNVSVHVDDPRAAGSALREVRGRGREALAQHGLPLLPVNVTWTGFKEPKGRELR
jgi:hypothetical protein